VRSSFLIVFFRRTRQIKLRWVPLREGLASLPVVSLYPTYGYLAVQVQFHFVRMGAGVQCVGFLTFEVAETLDEGLAEDAAFSQEGMVGHQRIAGTFKAGRDFFDLLPFLRGPILHLRFEGAEIERFGIHFLLNTINAGQQHGGNGYIGVAGAIRCAVFDANFIGVSHILRLADGGSAVATAKEAAGGSFKTRCQALKGVGGRVGKRGEGRGVVEDAADVLHGQLTKHGWALGIVE